MTRHFQPNQTVFKCSNNTSFLIWCAWLQAAFATSTIRHLPCVRLDQLLTRSGSLFDRPVQPDFLWFSTGLNRFLGFFSALNPNLRSFFLKILTPSTGFAYFVLILPSILEFLAYGLRVSKSINVIFDRSNYDIWA